ncbi:MAG: GNAT family N-acetyltransferase [Patescibacteria group bacterium]
MHIKIAETSDINRLKLVIKSMLQIPLGISLFNQRYGGDFTYEKLSKIIDSRQQVWIMESDESKLIGFSELWLKDDGYFELGYTIFPDYQKLGYGYSMVKTVFVECKDNLKIKFLKIEAETSNAGSIKIMEKLKTDFPISEKYINESYEPPTLIYTWKF